MLIAISRQ